MTFEEKLQEAAVEAHRIMMSSLPEPEDCIHEFSPKFERKMRRLTRRVDTPVKYHLQRAACIALVFLSIASVYLYVDTDAQAQFFGWVKETYESWVHYFFESDDTDIPMQSYEYRPTWLPDGYTENSVRNQSTGVMVIYKNADDDSIRFHYTTSTESRNLFVDGENTIEVPVQVHGRDALLYEPTDDETAPMIIWKNEDETVLFLISGYIELEGLVKMAESVEYFCLF